MSERRALLDPEMYKISEEDSQDEEVLSGGALRNYPGDVLGNTTDFRSWNNNKNDLVGRWSTGDPVGNLYGNRQEPEGSSSFSVALRKFNNSVVEERRQKITSSSNPNKSCAKNSFLSGTTTSLHVNPENLDWPETSSDTDSYLSSDDRRLNKSRRHGYAEPQGEQNDIGISRSPNNNKFVSKTYFGDHVRKLSSGSTDLFSIENEIGNHMRSPSIENQQPHQRKHLQKRSRRRPLHGAVNKESSSGSDYSNETTEEEDSCNDCVGSRSGSGRRFHSRGGSRSSSDVGDYEESSCSGSFSEDYDEYGNDDDEENEIFHDMAKYLNDGEVEASTKPNGDLFFVEYSAESEISDNEQTPFHQPSQHYLEDNSNESVDLNQDQQPLDDTSTARRNSGSFTTEAQNTETELVTRNEIAHFQKSGKGAKGKISRLLKRKKEKSKGPDISTESRMVSSTAELKTEPSTNSYPNQSKSSPTTSSLSVVKQKGQQVGATPGAESSASAGGSASGSGCVEKVFRFKDEHGGEIRTVFVDIPQEARMGNLLGRRATLIESILGILPGRFSTPVTSAAKMHNALPNNDRIMVAGFVPDGVASKYRRIKIGDWLQAVDDTSVDHGNIDQVLSSRSMYGKRKTAFETEFLRLKLTLRRVAGCMVSIPTGESDASQEAPSRIAHSSTEMVWGMLSPHVQANIAVLFVSNSLGGQSDCAITNDSNNTSPNLGNNTKDNANSEEVSTAVNSSSSSSNTSSSQSPQKEKSKDVVYCWPPENESRLVKVLAASQGMFSTLYRLLRDVTGSHPLVSKVVIDDCEMDVTYTSDDQGKSLLLVAVATTLSTYSIHHYQRPKDNLDFPNAAHPVGETSTESKKKEKKIRWREPQTGGITVSTRVMTRIESLLKYQFGSLSSAFKDTSTDEKVSRLLTNSICALNDLSEDFLFLQVPGNFLRFPNSIRSGIDDVLYSFETSDALFNSSTIGNTKSLSSRTSKDTSSDVPVFHCHGSCLMYKGFLVTSHLENELASLFHGWWRTQLALWEGIKRNSLHKKRKPISRLALWQQTCIPRISTRNCPVPAPTSANSSTSQLESSSSSPNKQKDMRGSPRGLAGKTASIQSNFYEGDKEDGEEDEGEITNSTFSVPPDRIHTLGLPPSSKFVRSFSALVGIGHFTLGFVLEHLTDYQGHMGPDVGWIRRAMATIGRLYQSGLSRSFECWLEKQYKEREEFVELSGTGSSASSVPSKHHHQHLQQQQRNHLRTTSQQQQQEKSNSTSSIQQPNSSPLSSSFNKPSVVAGSSVRKAQGTSSILKNTADSQPCPVHFTSAGVGSITSLSLFSTCTCSLRQTLPHSSSPFVPSPGTKSFVSGAPSSFNSSSSLASQSLIGNSGIRSGIIAATAGTLEDSFSGNSENLQIDSDTGEGGDDMDDTTTGTGSDNSSMKWYESGDLSSATGSTTGQEVKFIRVSRGNVLFDYLQVEFGRGVMLFTNDNHEGWVAVVRHNFHQSATVIHHILHKAANARNRLEERSYDKKWVSRALAPISEHGILFHCQVTEPRDLHKKKPRKRDVNYWVVGRIYPEEREIYICYEDGPMSQNLIEVAYKIALNVYC